MSIPFTWMYLIRDVDTGLYKIGRSDDPAKRLMTLIRQDTKQPTPNNYELIESWLCPVDKEAQWHAFFMEKRRRGEWFELDDEDIAEIETSLWKYQRWVYPVSREVEYFEGLAQSLYSQVAALEHKYVKAFEHSANCPVCNRPLF